MWLAHTGILQSSVDWVLYMYRVGQKTGLFLKVDNFATVDGRNAYDISKFSKFYLEKEYITIVSLR